MDKFKENDCSCSSCKNMCVVSPCFPTPSEVVELEEAGLSDKLAFTVYINPYSMQPYPLVAPKSHTIVENMINRCVFLSEEGLCKLHDAYLKPSEGRLAKCGSSEQESIDLRVFVANQWKTAQGLQLIDKYSNGEYKELLENYYNMLKVQR